MLVEYKVPTTWVMSSCKLIGRSTLTETARENALRDYNRMRDHDGLPPVKNLPKGTISRKLSE